jgi:CRISPR/Cas system-associated exonuclease Cas4 (RecB family)
MSSLETSWALLTKMVFMVLSIAHIELDYVLVTIKKDKWQCKNCQYNKYCLKQANQFFSTISGIP